MSRRNLHLLRSRSAGADHFQKRRSGSANRKQRRLHGPQQQSRQAGETSSNLCSALCCVTG